MQHFVDMRSVMIEAMFKFELDICLCRSQAKKDGAEDDIAKYDGVWSVEPLAKVTQVRILSQNMTEPLVTVWLQ